MLYFCDWKNMHVGENSWLWANISPTGHPGLQKLILLLGLLLLTKSWYNSWAITFGKWFCNRTALNTGHPHPPWQPYPPTLSTTKKRKNTQDYSLFFPIVQTSESSLLFVSSSCFCRYSIKVSFSLRTTLTWKKNAEWQDSLTFVTQYYSNGYI